MMKRNTRNPNAPRTIHDVAREAHEASGRAHVALKAIHDRHFSRRVAEFKASCGCERCGGRGTVITWDTLDSLSGAYAEYGACPNPDCTPESREASGLHPARWMHEHKEALESDPDYLADSTKEREAVRSLSSAAEVADYNARNEILQRGDRVVISRGRSGKGFVGTLFWMKSYGYGSPRVGVKDGSGHVEWTYAKNCDRVVA